MNVQRDVVERSLVVALLGSRIVAYGQPWLGILHCSEAALSASLTRSKPRMRELLPARCHYALPLCTPMTSG